MDRPSNSDRRVGGHGPRARRAALTVVVAVSAMLLTSCTGGMLDPASPRAERVVLLWWVMLVISIGVVGLVLGLMFIGLARARRPDAPERLAMRPTDRRFVFGGGIALPTVVMVVLMVLTVWAGRAITEAAAEDSLHIEIVGHQWWWEVIYPEQQFTAANEIHIPADAEVTLELTSADVIHSFWVPELGGKVDLVPGQTNTYIVEASEPGTYRGQCAEFCGLQHARMGIRVIVDAPADFEAWASGQARDAERLTPDDGVLFEGQQALLGSACVYCHTVRGTNASGEVGPDLTHLASRGTLAAGAIENDRAALANWIVSPQSVKPGTQMPPTVMDGDQLEALLDYLESLK